MSQWEENKNKPTQQWDYRIHLGKHPTQENTKVYGYVRILPNGDSTDGYYWYIMAFPESANGKTLEHGESDSLSDAQSAVMAAQMAIQ